MKGIQNVTHQEISAQQINGRVGVPGSNPTILLASQVLLPWALLSLNCMFVFMCWLLCLVSYNPVGADPKPHLKKKSNYFIPWVHSANKIDKQRLPVDLWRLRKKTRKGTNLVSDNGHDFWLIFPRECFSLEIPPNDSLYNYILYNTFFSQPQMTIVLASFFENPSPGWFVAACCYFSPHPNYSVVHEELRRSLTVLAHWWELTCCSHQPRFLWKELGIRSQLPQPSPRPFSRWCWLLCSAPRSTDQVAAPEDGHGQVESEIKDKRSRLVALDSREGWSHFSANPSR